MPLPDAPAPRPDDDLAGLPLDPSRVRFKFSGSRGPGGQNVNKRATKAELRVPLDALLMHPEAVERLREASASRITAEGELVIVSDETRSQEDNKAACVRTLRDLLKRAAARPKVRRPTRPTRGSVERRLEAKRRTSERKRGRGGDE